MIARAIRSPEHLARAAVGIGVAWLDAVTVDIERVALLEEALAALGESVRSIRVRVLSRLALALYWDPSSAARRDSLSREAVEMARRLDDPATLAYALEARHYALWDPDHVEERLTAATEMERVADRLRNPEIALAACSWRLFDLCEIGDIGAAEVEIARRTRIAEELRQPLQRSLATVSRAMRAMLDGRFAAADRLAEEARALGSAVQPDGTEIRFVCQILVLRRLQGRAKEMEIPLRGMIERYPPIVAFRCGLAAVYADLDRRAEARAEFEIAAAKDFGDLPRDVTWFANLHYLTDACVFLGDAARARLLYDLALPYASRNLVIAAGLAMAGSVSRLLGRLAFVLSRIEDAARHFEAALEMNERLGARPWLAHVQHEYAQVLSARDKLGDRERAEELLRRALATARELGMKGLAARISAGAARRPVARAVELRQDGDLWVVDYQGDICRLRDSKGLRVLAHLVKHPGADFLPTDLAAETEEPRVARGSGAEQTRVNLTKTIKAAIDKIAATNPSLGTHLRGAVHTGRLFRYEGAPDLLYRRIDHPL